MPNKPDVVNPAMALQFAIESHWRRVTILGRSTYSSVSRLSYQMFRLSRAFASTFVTWLVSSLFLFVWSFTIGSWQIHELSLTRIFRELLVLSYFIGIAVFPTCLIIVAPALGLLPRNSPLWLPKSACLIGAAVGSLAVYLWFAGFKREFFLPEFHDLVHVRFMVAAVVAGVTFALSYSRSLRKLYPALGQPSP